jgi:putative selenium metabolism hydrolase
MSDSRLIEFAQTLIRTPGLSGQEQNIARHVAAEMTALGFDQVIEDQNGSVIGVVEGAQPGPTLLFDAHTDTVGVSPGVPWNHEPYGGEIDGGAIYGRGSADMKGALAAMIHAVAALDRTGLAGRAVVSASVLEEVLEGVALAAVMARVHPDYVVIGESTNLNVSRGGRGRAEVHLTAIGKPSHSSSPHLGRNAVLDMMRVIAGIQRLELPSDPVVGPAILALTDIISEPYPGHSVIPSVCKVTYDRRLLPGESADDVLGAILGLPEVGDIQLGAVIAEGSYQAYTGATLTARKFFPGWTLAGDHEFVTAAMRALSGVGLTPQLSAYRFCTNAAYSAGVAGVPTIGFGPATEADAHVVDERLLIDDLLAAARGYAAIAERVLSSAGR